ncbi:hypothetical protein CLOM_g3653, partial [Closterium sp. NIES-68]
VVTMCRSLW